MEQQQTKVANGITVAVNVEGIDDAIAKAKELIELLERADALMYRISKDGDLQPKGVGGIKSLEV